MLTRTLKRVHSSETCFYFKITITVCCIYCHTSIKKTILARKKVNKIAKHSVLATTTNLKSVTNCSSTFIEDVTDPCNTQQCPIFNHVRNSFQSLNSIYKFDSVWGNFMPRVLSYFVALIDRCSFGVLLWLEIPNNN